MHLPLTPDTHEKIDGAVMALGDGISPQTCFVLEE